jgi:anti-sigma-K factor RskA
MNHIDDMAELYALGALDDLERKRVDAHVATCAQCARRLGEAERAVTSAIEADPQYEPSPALGVRLSASLDARRPKTRAAMVPRAWFAVAAAIAIVALPVGFMSRGYMAPVGDAQFANADFKMMKLQTVAMSAHVTYAKSGDFYAVMVKHPMRALHVAYVHPDGTMETIGKVEMHGDMGMAVMPIDHKMLELALVDGSTVVAEADLAFD